MLIALAQAVVLSWGWKRRAIAFAAGAIGALALAPADFAPAMAVPLSIAVWLIDGCIGQPSQNSGRRSGFFAGVLDAGVAGWWLGFGYFVAGLWWLGAAFLVEADQFAWALPLGVLGLPALLAFFFAFGFMLARILWSPGPFRIFALVAGLGLAEWLRGNLLSGFPWNAIGMALGGNDVTVQAASLMGLYGLTLFCIAIFAAPATVVDVTVSRSSPSTFRAFGIAVAALAILVGFGAIRLWRAEATFDSSVKLRIVQPNLPQDDKFRPERRDQILSHYLSLSDRATSPTISGLADVTHVVWPESPFPFILGRDQEAIRRIAGALPVGATLITGAARQIQSGVGSSRSQFFNSIQLLSSDGLLSESYDKMHLVPFGEYLPLARLFEKVGLRQFVHIPGGFDAGAGPRTLMVPGLKPAIPLICYEAIFPEIISPADVRAGWILNVTNDGWFGITSGPYQHLAQARMRSVEQGLPMIRAANTGISAVIDPYGRITARLGLGVEGVLDSAMPNALDKPPPVTSAPLLIPVGLWALSLLLALLGRYNRYNF